MKDVVPGSTRDRPPPYDTVVFDCDSTLCSIEGIDELAGEQRASMQLLTERAMSGEIALEEVYGLRLAQLQPTRLDVERIGRLYVETIVPGMATLVRELERHGKRVLVVSGGLLPAVRAVARALDLPQERVHAVDIEFAGDGSYRGFDRASPMTRSGGKIELLARLASHESLGRVAFVGDGITDLETRVLVDRFIAFGAVVRRENVFKGAAAAAMSVAALRPLLFSTAELADSSQ